MLLRKILWRCDTKKWNKVYRATKSVCVKYHKDCTNPNFQKSWMSLLVKVKEQFKLQNLWIFWSVKKIIIKAFKKLTLPKDSSLTLITLHREAGIGLVPDIDSGIAKGLSSGVHNCLLFIFGLKFVKICCGVVIYASWLSWLGVLFVIITVSILFILLPWHIERFSTWFIWKIFWGFGLSPILQRLSKLDQRKGLSFSAFFHASIALALRSVLAAIFPSKARANDAWSPNSSVKSSKLLADWLFSKRAASASAYLQDNF